MEITIDDKLYQSISDYCEINQMDFCVYVNKILKDAYMIDKYGDSPFHGPGKHEPHLPSNDTIEDEVQVPDTMVTKETISQPENSFGDVVEKHIDTELTIKPEVEEKKEESNPMPIKRTVQRRSIQNEEKQAEVKISDESKKTPVKRRILK